MHADAIVPNVANASAGMVFAEYLVVSDLISSTWIKPNPRYDSKCEYIFDNL